MLGWLWSRDRLEVACQRAALFLFFSFLFVSFLFFFFPFTRWTVILPETSCRVLRRQADKDGSNPWMASKVERSRQNNTSSTDGPWQTGKPILVRLTPALQPSSPPAPPVAPSMLDFGVQTMHKYTMLDRHTHIQVPTSVDIGQPSHVVHAAVGIPVTASRSLFPRECHLGSFF